MRCIDNPEMDLEAKYTDREWEEIEEKSMWDYEFELEKTLYVK